MSAADDKYNASERGRARHRRYNASAKGLARARTYREIHPIEIEESNARRLFVGGMYCGMGGFTRQEMEELRRKITAASKSP